MIGVRRIGWGIAGVAVVGGAWLAMCRPRPGPAAVVQVLDGEPAAWDSGGRIVVRFVPWVDGSDALLPGRDSGVRAAIGLLGTRLRAGTRYEIHVTVEPNPDLAVVRELVARRGARIAFWLRESGPVVAEIGTIVRGGAGADRRVILLPAGE